MQRPFSMANQLFAARPISIPANTHNAAGNIGGAAPQATTVGYRRDFTTTPLFLPWMTIPGGLKQPPRA